MDFPGIPTVCQKSCQWESSSSKVSDLVQSVVQGRPRQLTLPPRREIFSPKDKVERTVSTSNSFESDFDPPRREESPTMLLLIL